MLRTTHRSKSRTFITCASHHTNEIFRPRWTLLETFFWGEGFAINTQSEVINWWVMARKILKYLLCSSKLGIIMFRTFMSQKIIVNKMKMDGTLNIFKWEWMAHFDNIFDKPTKFFRRQKMKVNEKWNKRDQSINHQLCAATITLKNCQKKNFWPAIIMWWNKFLKYLPYEKKDLQKGTEETRMSKLFFYLENEWRSRRHQTECRHINLILLKKSFATSCQKSGKSSLFFI